MKKTWIKIKRGLLEPKHRDRLGIRIWLYVYILDNTDWETGQIREWRDKDAADEMQMPARTLTQHRQQLENDGYITCEVAGNKQIITIHNYTDPRKYDGEVTNPKGEGTQNRVPLEVGGNNKGDIQGDNKGLSKPDTPSYSSQITNHKDIEKLGGGGCYIFNLVGEDFNKVNNRQRIAITNIFKEHGEYRVCQLAEDYVAEVPDATMVSLLSHVFERAKRLPVIPLSEREGDYY